ncbi:MAG: hypothetical protein ACI9DK_003030 [Vicingaceae bacterium]|jgi:hypothetical protein
MTALELANLGSCGSGSTLGFNTDKGCADLLEAAVAVWLVSPSLVIADSEVIDADYIESLQISGDLIVIQGVSTFAENGSDDAIETLEDDTMILTNKGKYKFLATFAGKGLYWNRALSSVEGHGTWRTMIVDNKGDVFFTSNASGGFKGFTTGMIRQAKLQVASNTTSTKSGLEWQLLNRFELDVNYNVWKNENLAFDPRTVEPVTQVFLSLVNAPADADVTLTIKAVVDRGRTAAVAAALFGQFSNTIGGVASDPTAGDDSGTAGTYVLTIPALNAAEIGKVGMYSANSNVIKIAGDGLYKSNFVDYTVVA